MMCYGTAVWARAGFARWLALLVLCGLALSRWAVAEVAVPPLTAHINDLAGVIDPARRAALEQTLGEFETRRGAQIVVLTLPTAAPETIEQYALRVAEQWKLGRKGIDDGLLLVVATQDRALRIEVGYGLEGVIPDAVAKRIISEVIVPYFKQGDFAGGIEAGVQQVMRLVEGESLPAPERRATPAMGGVEASLPLLFIVTIVGGLLLRAVFGRLLGAGLTGVGAGILAWFLIGSLFFGLIAGLFAFFFLLGGGGRFLGGGGWGSSPRGGWGGGGFGGGMSGGGGGFGGGGASGRW